jgi:hypothetical protein
MLKINERFQRLLPPLSQSEFAKLEASIKHEGVRDPLVVWDDVIVDGHNRYSIAVENGIDRIKIVKKDFVSEDEACLWIVQNQSARRNLAAGQLAMIAGELAALPKGSNQHTGNSVCSQSQVAERFEISVDTIQQAKQVRSGGVAELVEAHKFWFFRLIKQARDKAVVDIVVSIFKWLVDIVFVVFTALVARFFHL